MMMNIQEESENTLPFMKETKENGVYIIIRELSKSSNHIYYPPPRLKDPGLVW